MLCGIIVKAEAVDPTFLHLPSRQLKVAKLLLMCGIVYFMHCDEFQSTHIFCLVTQALEFWPHERRMRPFVLNHPKLVTPCY